MGGAMTLAGRLLPPLALMAVIFALSAQPHLSTGLGTWDLILRKAAHMTEYGVLWWLWHRALRFRHARVAVAITLAYAATDEFHQHFVSGRHGTPVDVAIDAVGVVIAIVVSRRVARERQLRH
jgi:VanZ family protein